MSTATLAAAPHRERSTEHPIERTIVFASSLALFLVVGWRFAHAGVLPGDALSRTLNAASATSSRDPHLEAIGFVWPPFPTGFQVLLLAVLPSAKGLVSLGYAGVIVSATLMASATCAVRSWLDDLGLARATRLVLVAAFVLNPMILLYGANGMSEAGMICFLVLAARRLARWLERDATADLVSTGLWLSLAYLTRYEVAASIAAALAVVVVVVYRRSDGTGSQRRRSAVSAAAVLGLPPVFAAVAWALFSWAIVDEPFAQFTSHYGNSAIISRSTELFGQGDVVDRLLLLGRQVLAVGCLAAVAAVGLLWWGERGGRRVAAAVAVLGAPIAFHAVTTLTGSTFGFARFVIALVPLGLILLGIAIADARRRRTSSRWTVAVLGCCMAVASSALTLGLVRGGTLGNNEDAWALGVLPAPYHSGVANEGGSLFTEGRQIAGDIERLDPAHGDVVVDVAGGFPIVLGANDRRDYIITSDRDFQQVVADPYTFGARYLLVSDSESVAHDDVAAAFPTLYDDGAGISRLVEEWNLDTLRYRLYRIDKAVTR